MPIRTYEKQRRRLFISRSLLLTLEFFSLTSISVLIAFQQYLYITIPVILYILLLIFDLRLTSDSIPVIAHEGKQALIGQAIHHFISSLRKMGIKDVRWTFHLPTKPRDELFQVFDYVPIGSGAWRYHPINKGVIGKAYHEKELLFENFNSSADYREKMKVKYGFTDDEIRKRSSERNSYLCYAILDDLHDVLGLLYLDSESPNTFMETNLKLKGLLRQVAGEIKNAFNN